MFKRGWLLLITVFLLGGYASLFAPRAKWPVLKVDTDEQALCPPAKRARFTLPARFTEPARGSSDFSVVSPGIENSNTAGSAAAAMKLAWAFQGTWDLFEQRKIRSYVVEGVSDDKILTTMFRCLYGSTDEVPGLAALRRDCFAFWIRVFSAQQFQSVQWGDRFLDQSELLALFKELAQSNGKTPHSVGKKKAAIQIVNAMFACLKCYGVWDKSTCICNLEKAEAVFDWYWECAATHSYPFAKEKLKQCFVSAVAEFCEALGTTVVSMDLS